MIFCYFKYFSVDTKFCSQIRDLHNASGHYLRTVCLMKTLVTYTEAVSSCLSYKMNLYTIDNTEAKKALLDFANTRFEKSSGESLHIVNSTKNNCHMFNGNGLFDVFCGREDVKAYYFCQFVRKSSTAGIRITMRVEHKS